MSPQYWLFKSEPSEFSIEDLANQNKKTSCWDGVRNYQARNFLRDEVKKGDLVFFYHSNAKPPAVVGICEVVKEGYPDHTAFDKSDEHFDPKSDPENPRWYMVDIKLKKKFKNPIPLTDIKANSKLNKMLLVQRGQRLSVQPVTKGEWLEMLTMADR